MFGATWQRLLSDLLGRKLHFQEPAVPSVFVGPSAGGVCDDQCLAVRSSGRCQTSLSTQVSAPRPLGCEYVVSVLQQWGPARSTLTKTAGSTRVCLGLQFVHALPVCQLASNKVLATRRKLRVFLEAGICNQNLCLLVHCFSTFTCPSETSGWIQDWKLLALDRNKSDR